MSLDPIPLLRARTGHFALESGHHGQLWLDLEALFLQPARVARFAAQLAARLTRYRVTAVCGPLVEGAFVGLFVAAELRLPFAYAERLAAPIDGPADALFPVKYRLPPVLREEVRGRRVAIVNDVINAGSAVRGTLADLRACGAEPVVLASLLVLGPSAGELAATEKVALETLASRPNPIWAPGECPLCAQGVPLDRHDADDAGNA